MSSVYNSTRTPLAALGSFTGSSENCSAFYSICVSVAADQNSTLYLEYSTTGHNWDFSYSYPVVAGTPRFVVRDNAALFYRVRLTNDSGTDAQTYLRLSSVFKETAVNVNLDASDSITMAHSVLDLCSVTSGKLNVDIGTTTLSVNTISGFATETTLAAVNTKLAGTLAITITATVTVPSQADVVDDIVSDFRLEIDGVSYDAESYTGTATTATLVFDIDGDASVSKDETITAVLFADFEDLELADEGATIVAGVNGSGIEAEGVEDLTADGSAVTSATHTLRTDGVTVTLKSGTVVADENNDTITTDNAADYTLKFDVSSFGSDSAYLPFGAAQGTTTTTDGVGFSVINTNTNAVVSTGTAVAGLTTSGGTTVTKVNSFKVGSSPVGFTLTVNYDPLTAGSYKVRLDRVHFSTTDVATGATTQNVEDLNIETDAITISQ